MRVGWTPRSVRGVPRLAAVDLDATRAFDRWIAPRRDLLSTIALRGTYLDEDDVGRLLKLSLPGIDEVIGLLEITRVAAGGYDHVVIDAAPTGHTLRLLSSPILLERVAGLLDGLQSHHREVVRALRGGYTTDAADALIAEIEKEGQSLAAGLRDQAHTRLVWVTLPEPMALEETSDALSALSRDGIVVRSLLVNRTTPPPPAPCEWCKAHRRFEARAIRPIASRFANTEILTLPQLFAEPRDVKALRNVSASIARWSPPASVPPLKHRVRAIPVRRVASPLSRQSAAEGGGRGLPGDRPAVRWILFGGKGGVGKSTCAAAFALQFAASSSRPACPAAIERPGALAGRRAGRASRGSRCHNRWCAAKPARARNRCGCEPGRLSGALSRIGRRGVREHRSRRGPNWCGPWRLSQVGRSRTARYRRGHRHRGGRRSPHSVVLERRDRSYPIRPRPVMHCGCSRRRQCCATGPRP